MSRPSVHLAPMAGITDAAMRMISWRHGAEQCSTEMVSSMGLANDSLRTFQLLEKLPEEGPLVAHLYGGDAASMAEAARLVTERGGFVAIDINAGCPVQKVMKCGGGAALMRDANLVGKIVKAMVAATNLPVTLKTRIGLHQQAVTIFDIAQAVEDAGGSGLAVHGRFASDEHRGDVHFELLRAAVDCTKLPVVVNGGIQCAADAVQMIDRTGAAGVMVGRGAMGNPWLFGEIVTAFEGGDVVETRRHAKAEIIEKLKEHLALSLSFKEKVRSIYPAAICSYPDPELSAVHDFRHYLFNYFKGWPGSAELRRKMDNYLTIDEVLRAIEKLAVGA